MLALMALVAEPVFGCLPYCVLAMWQCRRVFGQGTWHAGCRHAPLQDVGDDAGVHEEALRELQRHPLCPLLPDAPHRFVHLRQLTPLLLYPSVHLRSVRYVQSQRNGLRTRSLVVQALHEDLRSSARLKAVVGGQDCNRLVEGFVPQDIVRHLHAHYRRPVSACECHAGNSGAGAVPLACGRRTALHAPAAARIWALARQCSALQRSHCWVPALLHACAL